MTEEPPFVGILMLDTGFQRIPGDVGNPDTFGYPVSYKTVKDASAARIVHSERPDSVLVNGFVEAARQLEAEGAIGLISSCGFLSVLQDDVASAVSIPVILSSLSLIPIMQSSIAHKPVGVITADETQLSADAFSAANIKPDSVCVAGMQSSRAFTEFIFDSPGNGLDKNKLCHDLVDTARKLLNTNPAISMLVLECTNLQPYAATLRYQLNLPVVGIVNAANLLWEISQPGDFQ